MNPLLMIAYDLKHQIECLPREHSQSLLVDKHVTTLTMQKRIDHIIRHLEKTKGVDGDAVLRDCNAG